MAFLSVLFAFPAILKLMTKFSKPNNDIITFFKTFSQAIITEKREKLKKLKEEEGQEISGRANNFLEMLFEAEREFETMKESKTNNGSSKEKEKKENLESKRLVKCKFFCKL